jgi:hypothetical protein
MSLPSLELRYKKTSDKQTSNNNTNTINNNIVLGTGLPSNLSPSEISSENPSVS